MTNNIIKTSPVQNNLQQHSNTKQLNNIKTTLAQLQSTPSFQAKAVSSPLLQNLLQLIKNIIKQLNQDPEQQEKPKLPHSGCHIKGTERNDKLTGGYNNDRIFGLGGNDRLKGRQGDDFLYGGAGRDRLYGGRGDDTLSGGKGNDYLSGGSGNNRLFGGDGNDTLVSRRGINDFLDGGRGIDTARIRGDIDDYSLKIATVFPQAINPGDVVVQGERADNGIILKHKTTGQTITVRDIEKFRFNDTRLSFDEIKQCALEQEAHKPLDISSISRNKLLALFENQGIPGVPSSVSVLDSNKDGKLSAGDVAILSGGFTGGEIARKTLSEADIQKLTDTTPSDVQKTLDKNRQKWAGSGVKNYSYEFKRSCFCSPDYTRPIKTTVENGEIKSSNYLDGNQENVPENFKNNKQSVNGLFDIIQNAIDNDRQLTVTYDNKTGMPTKIVIDENHMAFDGGEVISAGNLQNLDDSLLNISNGLSDTQNVRLSQAIFPQNIAYAGNGPSLSNVLDNNNDGKLSVGDTIVVRRFNGQSGFADFSQQALTQVQLDRYIAGESYIFNEVNPNEEPPLNGTSWQLQLVGSKAPYNDQHSSLSFNGSTISYNDGINNHGGSFNSNQQSGDFSVGNIFGTKIGSVDPLQNRNAEAINQGFSSASHYDISDDGTTLTFFDDNDQATLVYSQSIQAQNNH